MFLQTVNIYFVFVLLRVTIKKKNWIEPEMLLKLRLGLSVSTGGFTVDSRLRTDSLLGTPPPPSSPDINISTDAHSSFIRTCAEHQRLEYEIQSG